MAAWYGSWFALPVRRSFRWRVTMAFFVMDAAFMVMVVPAFMLLLRGYVASSTSSMLHIGLGVGLAVTAAWLLSVAWLLGPLERWVRAELRAPVTPELTRPALARALRLPRTLAATWSLKWVGLFALLTALHGIPFGTTAVVVFLAALALGPLPLAYLLALFFVSPLLSRIHQSARAAGMEGPARATTMRWQLALLSVCLCIAPSLYMTSVVFADYLPASTRIWMTVLFFGPVGLFALLCAVLFAATLVRPVRLIDATVQAIADQGAVAHAARIPPLRRDELGELAEHINVMVDRLEATERDRSAAMRAVEGLNQTLERRVAERTLSLAQANQALALEMKTRLQLEIELRQSQKLESVGRLASGIAHELNTPLQFVSDNLSFVTQSSEQLLALIESYQAVLAQVAGVPDELKTEVARAEERADLAYLARDVPKALAQAREGVERVTTIVRSMKTFARADQNEMTPCDLNQAVAAMLIIARHEYNATAEIETELGELPLVACHPAGLNQVLLNVLVNAVHAIEERGVSARGRIVIRTRLDRSRAVISIQDNGAGIPDGIRERVFDPFFTTKEVGKGIGQGLAVCRAVVVDQHGGELDFETRVGHGTTFFIRLPVPSGQATRGGTSERPVRPAEV